MNSHPNFTLSYLPILLVVILISCFHDGAAQTDSITHHYDSLAKIKLSALDTSNNRVNNKIDSVQLRLNNILNPNFNNLTSKLRRKKLQPTDTLQAKHELDSIKGGLTTKIDSLKQHNLPTEKYTRKLDSINNIGPQKYIEMANSKIQSVEDKANQPIGDIQNKINKPVNDIEGKINKPIDNVESKINDKLNVMRQEGGDNANIPGGVNTNDPGVGDVGVPGVDGNNLSLNKGLDTNLNTDLGVKTGIDNPISDQTGQLGELKDKVTDIKSTPQQQIDKVKSIDEIKTAQDKLGDVNTATDKIQSYQSDVKNISQGNLDEVKDIPGAIENKAGELDEIKALGEQNAELEKAKAMVDQDGMKEMAKQEVRKQAVDHFKGKEQALQAAMDKMSKLKQKYPELSSLENIPKRAPNPMKKKAFIERIVPGVTLQFQKTSNFMIDINPVVSYRFTGRINAGLGWNERLSFMKWNKLQSAERIYGPRVFGSFGFKKGFSAKTEVEKMNALIPPSIFSSDGSRQWVWSIFVGLKKDYKFWGTVRGNVQVLYNVFDDHDNSPYADRLNVRMGFEFPIKKVKKPIK